MQAIETEYKGIVFRSRLEARWAIFFDSLRIAWQYEPQKIHLINGINYIPDFLLPDLAADIIAGVGVWIEVKPSVDFVQQHKSAYFAKTLVSDPGLRHAGIYGGVPFCDRDGTPFMIPRPYFIATQDFEFFKVDFPRAGMSLRQMYLMRTKKGRIAIANNVKMYGNLMPISIEKERAQTHRF